MTLVKIWMGLLKVGENKDENKMMVGEKDEHVSFVVCNQQTDCLDKQLKGLFS